MFSAHLIQLNIVEPLRSTIVYHKKAFPVSVFYSLGDQLGVFRRVAPGSDICLIQF